MTTDNLLHVALYDNPQEIPAHAKRGVSTGLALYYISQAILNPNIEIIVRNDPDTVPQNRKLIKSCEWAVRRLNLLGFKVGVHPTRGEHYIRCDLIIDSKTEEPK